MTPAEANSSNFLARNISNACYGFAKMGFNPVQPGCSMMEALAAEAVVKLPGFIPQNFGNLLWAWGVLGAPSALLCCAHEAVSASEQ